MKSICYLDEGKSEAVEPQTEVDAAADVHIEDLTTGHTNEAFQDDAEIMVGSYAFFTSEMSSVQPAVPKNLYAL